jgi:hypothetical protein
MPRWATVLIIACVLLLALLLAIPFVAQQRELANRTRCQNNLRILGKALTGYAQEREHDAFPPGTIPIPGVPPEGRLSWHAGLLDRYGREDLARAVARDQPWSAEPNQAAGRSFVTFLVCPSLTPAPTPADQPAPTNYIGLAGVGADAPLLPPDHLRAGIFRYDGPTPLPAVRDGLSNTLMLGETGRDVGPWLRGGPPTVRGLDPARPPYLGVSGQFGGGHPHLANFINADGSLRVVRDDCAPAVLEKLVAIADGVAP